MLRHLPTWRMGLFLSGPPREENHPLVSENLLTGALGLTPSRSPANIPSGAMCIVSCDVLGLHVAEVNIADKTLKAKDITN